MLRCSKTTTLDPGQDTTKLSRTYHTVSAWGGATCCLQYSCILLSGSAGIAKNSPLSRLLFLPGRAMIYELPKQPPRLRAHTPSARGATAAASIRVVVGCSRHIAGRTAKRALATKAGGGDRHWTMLLWLPRCAPKEGRLPCTGVAGQDRHGTEARGDPTSRGWPAWLPTSPPEGPGSCCAADVAHSVAGSSGPGRLIGRPGLLRSELPHGREQRGGKGCPRSPKQAEDRPDAVCQIVSINNCYLKISSTGESRHIVLDMANRL